MKLIVVTSMEKAVRGDSCFPNMLNFRYENEINGEVVVLLTVILVYRPWMGD